MTASTLAAALLEDDVLADGASAAWWCARCLCRGLDRTGDVRGAADRPGLADGETADDAFDGDGDACLSEAVLPADAPTSNTYRAPTSRPAISRSTPATMDARTRARLACGDRTRCDARWVGIYVTLARPVRLADDFCDLAARRVWKCRLSVYGLAGGGAY